MARSDRDDPLAYGDYHARGEADEEYEGGERGLVGDTYRRLRSKYRPQQAGMSEQAVPPNGGPEQSGGLVSSLFNTLHGVVHGTYHKSSKIAFSHPREAYLV